MTTTTTNTRNESLSTNTFEPMRAFASAVPQRIKEALLRRAPDELELRPGESAEAILMKLFMKMTNKLDNAIRQQAKWIDRLNHHEQEVAKTNSINERRGEGDKLPDPAKPNPNLDGWTGIGNTASTATFEIQQLSKLRETIFSALNGAIDSYATSAKKMAEKVGQ